MNTYNKNYLWNTVGTVLNTFLSLFILLIITRINGIDSAGIFSQLFSLSLILQIISNYGTRVYQVTDIKNEYSFDNYFSSKIATSVISLIVMLIFVIINNFTYTYQIIAICLITFRIIETFSDVFYGDFQKDNRLDIVGISMCIKSLFFFFSFLISDLLTESLIISSLISLTSSFLVFCLYDLKHIFKKRKINFDLNIKLYFSSKYIFIYNFVTLLILNLPRFFSENLTLKDLGYLGILMMIPSIIALLCQFLLQPKIVNLTKLYYSEKKKEMSKEIKKTIILLIMATFLSILFSILFGELILTKIYGINFSGYKFYFVILILAGMFNAISAVFSNVLVIARKTSIQLYLYSTILFLGFVMIPYFLGKYSISGLYCSFCLLMFLQYLIFQVTYIIVLRGDKLDA